MVVEKQKVRRRVRMGLTPVNIWDTIQQRKERNQRRDHFHVKCVGREEDL